MANTIGDDYYHPMDREYKVKDQRIGPHVFEDVDGKFTTSLPKWIRSGAESIELQLGQGRAGEHGPESYGKEARAELKKLAEVTGVDVHTVHAPVSVQGLAGFGRDGFNEQERETKVNEIAKSIDFAADVTKGSNVVFHLGEFQRSMATDFKEFETYEGESEEADIWAADRTDGKIIKLPRKREIPFFKRDKSGEYIEDEYGNFVTQNRSWDDFNKDYEKFGKDKFLEKYDLDKEKSKIWQKDLVSFAFVSEIERNQISKMKSAIEDLEIDVADAKRKRKNVTDDEHVRILEREIKSKNERIAQSKFELAEKMKEKNNIVPIEEIALPRTADTLAKAGIMAMDKTKEKKLERPITLVPENIFPQDFGSHPDEMIKIVKTARQAMVDRLTRKEVDDPRGLFKDDGSRKKISNTFFRPGMSKKAAEKFAENHIKSTIDAQHLQMWFQHFKREDGETETQREKRFYEWYDENLRKLMKANVLGHVHIVDGMGRGHVHLPMGQGRITEMSEAIDELRSMGLSMTHEGWMEGAHRHLNEPWMPSDKGFYSMDLPGGTYNFGEVHGGYLGAVQAPRYLIPDELDFTQNREEFQTWSKMGLE